MILALKNLYQDRKEAQKVKFNTSDYAYQFLIGKKKTSFYLDMDDIRDIEKELGMIYEVYKKKMYVLKSSEKNCYHIYIPSLIYDSITKLKEDLELKIPKVNFDRQVYGSSQLFRLPYKAELSKKGIYNIFMTYSKGTLKPNEKVSEKNKELFNYVIHQKI